MRSFRRASAALTLVTSAALLAACSSDTSTSDAASASQEAATTSENATTESAADESATVVATTTILGNVTEQIVACADPEATVTTLMPVGADPHDFSPSSAQVAELVGADLVVANGLGLEAGLTQALESATTDGATVIEVADLVDPIPFGEHGHGDEHGDEEDHADEDGHEHADEDPHFWFDMNRMAQAAEIIGSTLAETRGQAYADCGTEVADSIRAAEAEVRSTLEALPADRRVLVTDHDAFGYLADVYGFEVVGTVIPGGSTLGEPSSADLADLVAAINAENVPAIFANTAEPSVLADAVAAETGRDVTVVPLYVGTLGEPGSGAEDYIGFMRTNAGLISGALNP